MSKILWIDTETGGLDPQNHSLLSVAFVVTDENMEVTDSYEWFIKHKTYSVTAGALAINGISILEHDRNAQEQKEVISEMKEFLKKHFNDDKPHIGGHNVKFDLDFMNTFLYKNKEYMYKWFSHRTVDTCVLLRSIYELGALDKEVFSLQDAIKHFGIDTADGEAHVALYDTLATVKLFKKIGEEYIKGGESHV